MVVNVQMKPMMSVREVAQLLHIHPNTLRRWSDRGIITAYQVNQRGDRRFKPEDVDSFISNLNNKRTVGKS